MNIIKLDAVEMRGVVGPKGTINAFTGEGIKVKESMLAWLKRFEGRFVEVTITPMPEEPPPE